MEFTFFSIFLYYKQWYSKQSLRHLLVPMCECFFTDLCYTYALTSHWPCILKKITCIIPINNQKIESGLLDICNFFFNGSCQTDIENGYTYLQSSQHYMTTHFFTPLLHIGRSFGQSLNFGGLLYTEMYTFIIVTYQFFSFMALCSLPSLKILFKDNRHFLCFFPKTFIALKKKV